jgi:hypothetical protein
VGPDDSETDLDQVVDKLAQRYPERSRESLRLEVEKAHRSFSGAKVHDFLPVLIERQVRASLRDAPAT